MGHKAAEKLSTLGGIFRLLCFAFLCRFRLGKLCPGHYHVTASKRIHIVMLFEKPYGCVKPVRHGNSCADSFLLTDLSAFQQAHYLLTVLCGFFIGTSCYEQLVFRSCEGNVKEHHFLITLIFLHDKA